MKNPVFEQLTIPEGCSLNCKVFSGDAFFCPIHSHPEYEVVFISQGEVDYVVGDRKSVLSENELLLAGPNLPHGFYSSGNGRRFTSLYIHLQENLLERLHRQFPEFYLMGKVSDWFKRGTVFHLDPEGTELYHNIFSHKHETRLMSLLTFLLYLNRQVPVCCLTQNYYPDSNKLVETIISLVMMNAQSPLSLPDMASQMNMSVATFTRVFKKHFGVSYIEFVTGLKVEQACHLLVYSSYAVTRIALEAGFTSVSQFNKKFKEKVGVSPSQYRKEWQSIYLSHTRSSGSWDIGTTC